ncbi:MAG: hypothetical protein U5S82_04025 [Gammaproteobacteria bacterium]|nr:hypothetical protein [Gammaproteobacteria bacterium]
MLMIVAAAADSAYVAENNDRRPEAILARPSTRHHFNPGVLP